MATGLLVMGIGRGTRLLRFLGDLPKTYEGSFRLGIETDTLDAEGAITRESPVGGVTASDVRAAMGALQSVSTQRPPAFSAVKVGGRKLYEAARAGEHIEAPERSVHVDRFDLVHFEPPDARFSVTCSGGTYVRVLVADVGSALGPGAHLTGLRRISIGPFEVSGAVSPDDPGSPLPLADAVRHLPRVAVSSDEAIAASHGRPLGPAGIGGPHAVYDPMGLLLGVYLDEGAKARPLVILEPA